MDHDGNPTAQGRLFTDGPREPEHVTVLSFGMGQQSTAVLLRLLFDPGFRQRYAPQRLLILTSDTGDEAPETYAHLYRMKGLCEQHGEELVFLTPDLGFHTEAWTSLIENYRAGPRIGSKAYPKTCSQNLKVLVQLRYLASRLAADYGLTRSPRYSRTFREYTESSGYRMRFLLGISAEEANRRIRDPEKDPQWQRRCLERLYPLADLGWERRDCQDYIRSLGFAVPVPSSCRHCPFTTDPELVLLARTDPDAYEEWVRLERAKLDAHAERFPHLPPEKNFGVWPHKTLPEALADAEAEYRHLSTAELEEMRMSRGHAVGTCY